MNRFLMVAVGIVKRRQWRLLKKVGVNYLVLFIYYLFITEVLLIICLLGASII